MTAPTTLTEALEQLDRARALAVLLEQETADADATVARVRALHVEGDTLGLTQDSCTHCDYPWPCPTVVALDGGV